MTNFVSERSTLVAVAAAHAMAWVAFLWLVIPRCIFEDVVPRATSMAIGSCSLDYDVWGFSWFFVPVLLTGVAMIFALSFRMSRWWGALILGVLSVLVVGICAGGYLGFGIMYVPSGLAMLVATVVHARCPRTD